MQLFSDINNSPLPSLPDFIELRRRSTNSFEEIIHGRMVDSFFDDPECRRSVASLDKQEFILDINQNEIGDFQVFDVAKKIKKTRKKPDYKKNICGYITKRIIREFLDEKYRSEVFNLCRKYDYDINNLKSFFLARIESITGPRHLQALLRADNVDEVAPKRVFLMFMQWFLKERYIRYLLLEGKMSDKRTYIEYKNTMISKYVRSAKTNYE